ncbi:hypothetical protein VTL71DRAFT_2463 [Oculimacula yallundae]|uniref:Uncharacterized protein n=1 Tax=Oculimacula yallundae TaxID=86028 RepID=A0ABR4CA55_9HELO
MARQRPRDVGRFQERSKSKLTYSVSRILRSYWGLSPQDITGAFGPVNKGPGSLNPTKRLSPPEARLTQFFSAKRSEIKKTTKDLNSNAI